MLVERIKEQVEILDVLNLYGIPVNAKGFVSCVFHDEATPSLKIYPDTNTFYCFGCGTGGDVIYFVRHLFHLSFPQAVRHICNDFGVWAGNRKPLSREGEEIRRKRAEKQKEVNEYREKYMAKIACFSRCREDVELFRPRNGEPPGRIFLSALTEMEYIDYWLSEHPWK